PPSEYVVPDCTLAAKGKIDHLLTVDDKTKGLSYIDVVERRLIDPHGEGCPLSGSRHKRLNLVTSLLTKGERREEKCVDLSALQGIESGCVCWKVDEGDSVKIGLTALPISIEARKHALLTRRKALVLKGPRSDRRFRVVVTRYDTEIEALRNAFWERGKGRMHWDPQCQIVQHLQTVEVDSQQRGGASLWRLGVANPSESRS